MKHHLPKPSPETIIYEDKQLYVCLAHLPLTEGHTVIVWKKCLPDLHLLKLQEYKHLMTLVDKTRTALLKTLHLEKVYLIYMDEARHVHWHLVPRYNEKGYNILEHTPEMLKITPKTIALVEALRKRLR